MLHCAVPRCHVSVLHCAMCGAVFRSPELPDPSQSRKSACRDEICSKERNGFRQGPWNPGARCCMDLCFDAMFRCCIVLCFGAMFR